MFGKLTVNDLPFLHDPIIAGAGLFMVLAGIAIIGALTYFKKWQWLWTEWITSVDHKKIGVMYLILAFIMLFRGFADAIMMRLQQAMAAGNSGYLPPEHFDQVFTAHGVIMIFFMAMPFLFGLLNLIVPLQIGARDVAYPFLNSLSFWLTVVGAILVNVSLVIGDFAATGWLAYPPLSGLKYSPTVGVDYYLWSLQIAGLGTLLSGINFFATIIKMRCPGMTMMKMPPFTWSALVTVVLVILAFPVLTVTFGMLFLDRFMGMHFFTSAFGGNPMMYINLIWAWGHPEVYILVIPAFGIFSEIVATFSQKRLFGYYTMVWAMVIISVLSFSVWVHHFFTMGAGPAVNAVFGIATMIIAVPTGVKVFNWLFTMYQGRVIYTTPMLWTIGFLVTFTIGGMTGVILSIPAIDFQLHNSVFLIAHFHNTIIGGVVFGYLAGLTYWFPKIFGFKLNERLGKYAFWCWLIGFFVAFMPLYILGFMGMTRRLNHYDASTGWQPFLIIAGIGALIIAAGIGFQVLQLLVSIKNRNKEGYKDTTGDPWNGRTLEWSTPSPVPFYNFPFTPEVHSRDAFWEEKQEKIKHLQRGADQQQPYQDIHMPRNTSVGFIVAAFSLAFGFGMIWEMYWLVFLGLIGMFSTVIKHSFNYNIDYYVKAEEVAKTEIETANRMKL
ncbi:cytochrome ubiquinol oxidase subunit I [Piscirickettsia salmonis]|uniref:Cytochrome bo(3) ubiquinol oxidase subunit 1 n=1 Tax=Piscirickettsia salmonis TaxID=1238 RepID=A0A9Q6LST2_PISSA|nr:cytochrome o ubiquinol oxidase subunit I [Piscirickettsia salmonis]ALA24834.1 cytochrome o ubiquinol oxidase, subunit I [Piscirickettsia salmonis]APS45154.1 cytochrome ubiquinol oxidase subunit I [Piscirickettsia salmonis]APS48514.1 cytochrome ubiquinol oxidase subunit I [Piscirickettsia salmonis]APS52959.1 cytochrome ubiquinol oxidase subunit I [Piscirickettsia salmonis]APS56220.1 cytochrome ubiquinol oxidase subunit I [Piscirickettsia salmonis]